MNVLRSKISFFRSRKFRLILLGIIPPLIIITFVYLFLKFVYYDTMDLFDLMDEAEKLCRQDKYNKAILLYKYANLFEPSQTDEYHKMGLAKCYFKMGKYKKSLDYLKDIYGEKSYYLQGWNYFMLNDYSNSKRCFNEAYKRKHLMSEKRIEECLDLINLIEKIESYKNYEHIVD